jgi:hypothetical protein
VLTCQAVMLHPVLSAFTFPTQQDDQQGSLFVLVAEWQGHPLFVALFIPDLPGCTVPAIPTSSLLAEHACRLPTHLRPTYSIGDQPAAGSQAA